MNNTIVYVALIVVAGIIGVAALIHSDHTATRLMQDQECVVKTAQYNHYAGDPFSQEAWNLFISECE